MVKLHFKNTDEFEALFKVKNLQITNAVVKGIESAMMKENYSAKLFSITFDDVDIAYDISLPRKEWKHALESCLDYYHTLKSDEDNIANKQIEAWKLLELAKVW